jgi:hypothetical protein
MEATMKIPSRLLAGIILACAFSSPAPAAAPDCSDLIAQSEKQWVALNYNESDKTLDLAQKQCPDLGEIYWRKARNIYDRVESLPRDQRPGKDESVGIYNRIIDLADKCIALSPADGVCYHWKGVGIGRRGSTKGMFSSLGDLRLLDTTMQKAEDLKPAYHAENGAGDGLADIYDARGMLYRVVPDWFILQALFGARGDLAKSVEYQRKAVARVPWRIEYNKELGVSLICYGQKNRDPKSVDEGREYLKKIAALPVLKSSDKVDQEHAKLLLANPDLACGYSRDAQQAQSMEEFEKTRKK